MIKDFVFDMGNVLILFQPELFVRRLGVSQQDAALLLQQVFYAREWAQMDDGSRDEQEVCDLFKTRLPAHLHSHMVTLVTAWEEPIMEVEGMSALVGRLKRQGYGIYLLSNASRRQHEYWGKIPASRYFDGTLISADVGMVKPDPGIYRRLFDTFGLRPETSFFIDDMTQNIAAGKALGMPGHVFDGDMAALERAVNAAIGRGPTEA